MTTATAAKVRKSRNATPKYPHIRVRLTGVEGHAIQLTHRVVDAMEETGLPHRAIKRFIWDCYVRSEGLPFTGRRLKESYRETCRRWVTVL